MYGELASVRGVVDLSPQEALDRAEFFLTQQGYTVMQRDDNSLTAQRGASGQGEEYTPNLTVEASPQPEGGVRITVRGNDREEVQANQAAWAEWSEGLPKKPEAQPSAETHEVGLPPPPTVESADLPPAPQPPPVPPLPRLLLRKAPGWGLGPS